MAELLTIKDDLIEPYMNLHLHSARSTWSRLKFAFFMLVVLVVALVTNMAMQLAIMPDKIYMLAWLSTIMLGWPMWDMWKTYNGINYPRFNYRKFDWVLGKPIIIPIKLDDYEEMGEIADWLESTIPHGTYYRLDSTMRANAAMNWVFVLFLHPKDAMLFKLSI